MKKLFNILLLLMPFTFSLEVNAAVILTQGFENGGSIPTGWTQEYVTGTLNWAYQNGGRSGNPAAAHTGSYNAYFYRNSTTARVTKLVTPVIDFGANTVNTQLTFWHTQAQWTPDQDELRVYYKESAGGSWTLLAEYTDNITSWTKETISLPHPNSTYYIAFEGTAKYGYGVCVDDVEVTGEPYTQKSLTSITYNQAATTDIATNSSNNEILRLDFQVAGSTGTLYLNSIDVKSLNTTDADIASSGVKLYATTTTTFSTATPVGSGVSFSSGTASFTSLNYDLPAGTSYIWVTYDIASSATANNIADAKIEVNKINVDGSTYPSSEQSPAGSRTIKKFLIVGTSTDVGQHLPIEPYYKYTYSQTLFKQSYINKQIDITKLYYYYNGNSAWTDNIVIYMGHTTKSAFINTTDWVPTTSMTQVYNSTITTTTTPGWVELTLSSTFSYNNTDNLVIAIDENTNGYHSDNDEFYCSNMDADNKSIYYYNDNTNPNPASPPTGTLSTYSPNIKLEYTDPPAKTLTSITYNQASTATVAVSSTNKEILRLDFNVTAGLAGSLLLNSLTVTSNGTNDADIAASGVKLYTTTTSTFSTSNPLGTAQSLSGRTATFSSLNYDLPSGTSYVWVTYDISATATATNVVDAKIAANNINVGGSTYPATEQNPAGTRTIVSNKSLNSITYNQASIKTIGINTTNNPILRLDFNVTGTSGTLLLNSIQVTSNNTNDADIATSGVRLYRTTTTTFSTTNPLGTAQTFAGGLVTFSSLSYDLPTGTTYIWVTYNTATTATAGRYADAKIAVNGINVGSTTYPAAEQSPTGNRIIATITSSFPYTETFGNAVWGTWFQKTDDDFNWSTITGAPATANTGPSGAYNGTYYIYTESSAPNSPYKTAKLDAAFNFSTLTYPELIFYYHMYGATMGDLYVDIYDGTWHDAIWSKSGQQNTGRTDPWKMAQIDLTAYAGIDDIIIRFRGVTGSGATSDMAVDYVTVKQQDNLAYSSSTTTQTVTSTVIKGATDQQIIGSEIVITGTLGSINATSFTFNTTGSTSPSVDIDNAKLFYTGTSSTFATTTQFGSTYNNPNGSFIISSTQSLSQGTNYFWLTYDIKSGATSANVVDAQCTSITVGGSARTPTVTAPAGTRTIESPLAGGTYTVGTGGNYATLTAVATDINRRGVSGPVVFELIATYSSGAETFPIAFNEIFGASATNTITIKPAISQTPSIQGSSASGIIKLNGADYFIIDGSNNGTTSIDMTISNTSTANNTAAIWVASLGTSSGATNNTIKNCNIKAGSNTSTSTFPIYIAGSSINTSGTGDDNDNLTIQNNSISKAYYGIYAVATSSGLNNNLTISSNTIGSGVSGDYITGYGIYLKQATGASIRQNTITNIINNTYITYGISLLDGVVSSSVIRNNINGVKYTGSSGFGSKGIEVNTSNSNSSLTIANNFIYDISGDGYMLSYQSGSEAIIGIRIAGNTGGINVYYNTINLFGSISRGSATNDGSAPLYVASTISNLNIRNNIFVNSIVNTTGTAKAYSIYSGASSSAFTNIDYNNYYYTNAEGVFGYLDSDIADIVAWRTVTGKDAKSVTIVPLFTSNTNLHIKNNYVFNGIGTPISGITEDYDGNTRDASYPDLGADEFTTSAKSTYPYSTDFSNVTDQEEWAKQQITGNGYWNYVSSMSNPALTPIYGSYFAYFNSNFFPSGVSSRLVSPSYDITGLTAPYLKFYMSQDADNPTSEDKIQIFISTDGGNSYTNLGEWMEYNPGYSTPAIRPRHIDLREFSSNNLRIAFQGISNNGSNMCIDQVEIYDESCPAPTNLTTSDITYYSALLNWISGTGDSYKIKYKPIGSTSYSSKTTTSTSFTITNLLSDTQYVWYVQTYCSGYTVGASPIDTFATNVHDCPPPSNLTSSDITTSSAILSWNGYPSHTQYKIRYSKTSVISYQYKTITANSLKIGNLESNTEYFWQIETWCDNYTLGYSIVSDTFTTMSTFRINPNIIKDNTIVSFNSEQTEKFTLKIFDMVGREVFVKSDISNEGLNAYNVDLSMLSLGIYSATLERGSKRETYKIIKQ